jgi:hypothetical protein
MKLQKRKIALLDEMLAPEEFEVLKRRRCIFKAWVLDIEAYEDQIGGIE